MLVPFRLHIGGVAPRLKRNKSFVDAFYVLLVRLRKVLLVVPHAIKGLGAAFRRRILRHQFCLGRWLSWIISLIVLLITYLRNGFFFIDVLQSLLHFLELSQHFSLR